MTYLIIYAAISVAIGMISSIYDGWCGGDRRHQPVLAFFWPLILVVYSVIAPFWAAYKLGELLRNRRERSRTEAVEGIES